MSYKLIRPILFALESEFSHNFSLKAIELLDQLHLLKYTLKQVPVLPIKVMGLTFNNAVGLAAGLDKNGDYIDALGSLGFGFIEIGTVTPKPQAGNPKPRLFRLKKDHALLNRMGFNNKGVDHLISKVKQAKYDGILGINIGKNADTPIENAIEDYRSCLVKVYEHASYITINISSPNTPGLRTLQSADYLNQLLKELKQEQQRLANDYNKYVPLVIKIAPDLELDEIANMAALFIEHKIDGIIATNTTLQKSGLQESHYEKEAGGLSGEPLFFPATKVLAELKQALDQHQIPLIASGGIMSAAQARKKVDAGADLVQLYTGLIYEGPSLISACLSTLNEAFFEKAGKKCQID